MKIEILEEARLDLLAGFDFYEKQAPGLGTYFIECLYSDIDTLKQLAGVHRIVLGSHRSHSRRFPYAIYYRVESDVIRVRAILDCRRNPSLTRRRLNEP